MKNVLIVCLLLGTSLTQKAVRSPFQKSNVRPPTVIAVAAGREGYRQPQSTLSRAEFVRQNGLMYPQTCCDIVGGVCWVAVVVSLIGGCFYSVSQINHQQ